jgi:hypothetical protein
MAVNAAFPSPPWAKGVPEKDTPLSQNMRQYIGNILLTLPIIYVS